MKLLREVFRLRDFRSLPFAVRREASRREFVVTVPAPLPANAAAHAVPSGPAQPAAGH
jgi:hypothetical protein